MDIHIGNIIEQVFNESGMQLSVFAQRLNTVPRNVYTIFKRKEIKTDQLQLIGKALNHDFFKYFQEKNMGISLEEPQETYYKNYKSKISINVELDGSKETAEKWIKLIPEINQLLNKK